MSAAKRRTWLWVAGFALLVAAGVYAARRRQGSRAGAQFDSSGDPRAFAGGDGAGDLGGAAGGSADSGMPLLVQGQVDTTPQGSNDDGSSTTQAATASGTRSVISSPGGLDYAHQAFNSPQPTVGPSQVGSVYQSATGSQPTYIAPPVAWTAPVTPPSTSTATRRPGLQI